MVDSNNYISNMKVMCLKFSSAEEETFRKELQTIVEKQNEKGYRLINVQVSDENDQEICLRLLFDYVQNSSLVGQQVALVFSAKDKVSLEIILRVMQLSLYHMELKFEALYFNNPEKGFFVMVYGT